MPEVTFLLVDDDPEDIAMLAEALQEIEPGINIKTLDNGYDALQWLQLNNATTDFVFLDLNMPRVNGIQCLKKMGELGLLARIPVIIYSTSKQKEDKESSLAMGAACFITKPNSYRALVEKLKLVLEKQWQKL